MGLSMRGIGKMIYSMGRVWKHGQMEVSIKATIKRGKSMEKESMYGAMVPNTKENGLITKLTEKESTPG